MIGARNPRVIMCLLWVTLCAQVPSVLGQSNAAAQEYRYEDAARTRQSLFAEGRWSSSEVLSNSPSARERQSIEVTSVPVKDCSDERYRCIVGSFRVFAVPRGALLPTSTYVAAGSSFRVEECYRGDATHCSVALISSDCQQRSGRDGCSEVLGGRTKSNNTGPVLYFIYNEDFGVTAYGSVHQPASTEEERRIIAAWMVLRGERGLLSHQVDSN